MKLTKIKVITASLALPVALTAAGLLVAAGPKATAPNTPATAQSSSAQSSNESTTSPVLSQQSMDVANALSDAFRQVATHVLPSVVAIENRPDENWQTASKPTDGADNPLGGQNPFKGTPFEDMFRQQDRSSAPGNTAPRRTPRPQGGIGSGVIIDAAGIVLTNNHVVTGGGKVVIKTQDGREYVATEVLTDPKTDIAVVRFEGDSNLVAAKIGNSDLMEVGDWVVALGQPFGLEGTVTTGIVSGKNRGIGITDRENFIQTDAAINPGNSGGPLVNLRGEVIGINTAISSRGGGNDGIGFAVPSNLASWVSEQLVSAGHVNRSYLGVAIQPVSYNLSSELGVAPNSGVAVTDVFAKTPAEKTGLKAGDVIVNFGGIAVRTPQQLQLAVERSPEGKKLVVDIVRDRKAIQLSYVGESLPGDFGAKTTPAEVNDAVKLKSIGLEITALTDEVAKQLGMDDQNGVVVTRVQVESAAESAGLEPGMVIVQVNRQNVTSVEKFEKLVAADSDDAVLLLVRTSQGSRFVVIER